jgi:sulfide dehydrogenase cytochrome subunit
MSKIRDHFVHLMQNSANRQKTLGTLTKPGGRSIRRYGSYLIGLALFFPIASLSAGVSSQTPVCSGCHGVNGVSLNSMVPSIAGQAYTLIEDNLLAFRDDELACGETEFLQGEAAALVSAMCAFVTTLEDADISALAEFYEMQTFVPAKQPFNPALAADGARIHRQANCELCHSQGGRESNGMSAILAGQWTPYLERSLLRIRAGEKTGPKVMNRAIHEFTDADIAALLNYYASQ